LVSIASFRQYVRERFGLIQSRGQGHAFRHIIQCLGRFADITSFTHIDRVRLVYVTKIHWTTERIFSRQTSF